MSFSTKRRGFTLVELLVVIGIIAALIGILLPVLSGVQARGRDLKCQSNLRQIVQAMIGYAAENKGIMPYGFYYDPSVNDAHPDPWNSANHWGPKSGSRFISWASLVGKYMVRRASGDNGFVNFPPVLKCPEAEMVYPHVVSYAANWVVSVSPFDDLRVGRAPQAQLKPPPQTLLMKDTALLWDTAIQPDWANSVGFLLGADIDAQRFWEGARSPQLRYWTVRDIFGNPALAGGQLGQNKPMQITGHGWPWLNIDPLADTHFPYQGNLRFRHARSTVCNTGFADGSVRAITAKLRSDKSMEKHDGIRRYFMIKWPPGVPPDTSRPH
jgi:prepilin-type N-terminal cleavage/methylation domain-containing protein/prepilin-type processing-associated H-X9-DG protein